MHQQPGFRREQTPVAGRTVGCAGAYRLRVGRHLHEAAGPYRTGVVIVLHLEGCEHVAVRQPQKRVRTRVTLDICESFSVTSKTARKSGWVAPADAVYR